MTRFDVKEYYQQLQQAGEQYNSDRFVKPGGRAVSELELKPFRDWLNLKPGEKLLDCASGTGRVLSTLTMEQRSQATAMDGSENMLNFLKQAFPEVKSVQGDLFSFAPEEKFDVVTSLRVLDHFNLADQESLLRRFTSYLTPGGRMIFSVLVGPTLESLANRFTRVGVMNYFHSRSAYKKLFDNCGLKMLRKFDAFVMPRGILYRMPKLLVGPTMLCDRAVGTLCPPACSYMTVELAVRD